MRLSREFFELRLRFAQKAARVRRDSLVTALLQYTHHYRALGLGRDFDAGHPVGQAYVPGLQADADHTGWTYQYYLGRQAVFPSNVVAPAFGCFYCSRWDDNRVRLHFWNGETTD